MVLPRHYRYPSIRHFRGGLLAGVLAILVSVYPPTHAPASAAEAERHPANDAVGRGEALFTARETSRPDDFWVLRAPPLDIRWSGEPWTASLARFSIAEGFLEERLIELPEGRPIGGPFLGSKGYLWVSYWKAAGDNPDGGTAYQKVLQVYGPDGVRLSERPIEGRLAGLSTDDEPLILAFDDSGSSPRIEHLDPAAGRLSGSVAFRDEEFGPRGGGCVGVARKFVVGEDRSYWLIRGLGLGSDITVVRRFSENGAPQGTWRLDGTIEGAHGAAGDALLMVRGDRVVRLDPDLPDAVSMRAGSAIVDLLGLEHGTVALVHGGRRVRVWEDDGTLVGTLDLDLPPAGMSFAERQRTRVRLASSQPTEGDLRTLLDRLVLEQSSVAQDAVLRAEPSRAAAALLAAFERWGWQQALVRTLTMLVRREPVAAGEIVAAHLMSLDSEAIYGDLEERLGRLLKRVWEHPSPTFIHRLGDDLVARSTGEQEYPPLARLASSIFLDARTRAYEDDGSPASALPVAERFPPPDFLVDHLVTGLAPQGSGQAETTPVEVGDFFLLHFNRSVDHLEARLLEPEHPDHFRTLEVMAHFTVPLSQVEDGTLGVVPGELRQRAGKWGQHPLPAVSRLGTLLSATLGDPAAMEDLLDHPPAYSPAIEELAYAVKGLLRRTVDDERPAVARRILSSLRRNPEGPHVQPVLRRLDDHLDEDALAGVVDWLAESGLSCELRANLEDLISEKTAWPRVPDASLARWVATGHPATGIGDGCKIDYSLAAMLWPRLAGRPELRSLLEERVAATLPDHVLTGSPPPRALSVVPDRWLLLFLEGPDSPMTRRLVPTGTLEHLTHRMSEHPKPLFWIQMLARAADIRGVWPGWLDLLAKYLAGNPGRLSDLPPGAADRWLGRATVDRLVLTPPSDGGN